MIKHLLLIMAIFVSGQVLPQTGKSERVQKDMNKSSSVTTGGSNYRQQSLPHLNEQLIEPGLVWQENFGTCLSNNGDRGNLAVSYGWTREDLNPNASKANLWFVSATAPGKPSGGCSESWPVTAEAGTTNRTLHIGKFGDDAGAFYASTEENITDSRIQSPAINFVGLSDLSISFDYYTGGDGQNSFLEFWCYDGQSWILVTTFLPTPECNQEEEEDLQGRKTQWTKIQGLVLPETANNQSGVKIGFRWVNWQPLQTTSNLISAAIDNIKIYNKSVVSNEELNSPTERNSVISAKIIDNHPQINFSSNLSGDFIIQKSLNGVDFTPVATIKSTKGGSYTWSDNDAGSGLHYYRVQEPSGVVSPLSTVNLQTSTEDRRVNFTIYPNPNSGQFVVDFGGIENNFLVDLYLFDSNSNIVYTKQFEIRDLDSNKLDIIPNSTLKNGRYYCTLSIEGIKYTSIVIVN